MAKQILAILLALLAAASSAHAATSLSCEANHWDDRFAYTADGMNDEVRDVVTDGNDFYVGGKFTMAGQVPAAHIAKWDGNSWSPLGSGVDGEVYALLVDGGNVYAGGTFNNAGGGPAANVAKWNGSTWSALGSGTTGGVYALAMMGGDLYAAGVFNSAGGVSALNIAKWDGSTWSPLGSGVAGGVGVLAVMGTDLFAGGSGLSVWNGSAWLGTWATGGGVGALAVKDGQLYVGGYFTFLRGGLATWSMANGFEALPSRLSYPVYDSDGGFHDHAKVTALTVVGNDLYAAGDFNRAGGKPVKNIARWDGSAWSRLGAGIEGLGRYGLAATSFDLFAVGDFYYAGRNPSINVARWTIAEAVCGDGSLDGCEQCDDGNGTSGDGCSASCEVEDCWTCSGLPSSCSAQTGTACPDDGDNCTDNVCNAGACTHSVLPDNTSCASTCRPVATCQSGVCQGAEICLTPLCGNDDPCVVQGKTTLEDGTVLDLDGRALQLASGAVLNSTGSFSIVNAASVTLDPRSKVTSIAAGHDERSIQIESAGSCALNGIIQANGRVDAENQLAGDGGAVVVSCADIAVGPKGVVEANGKALKGAAVDTGFGGSISLTSETGPLTAAKGAKLNATGAGDTGGDISLQAAGDCTLAAAVKANSTTLLDEGDIDGGDGGSFEAECDGSMRFDLGSSLSIGTVPSVSAGRVTLIAAGPLTIASGVSMVNNGVGGAMVVEADAVTIEPKTKIRSVAKGEEGGTLEVTSPGICSLGGTIAVKASAMSIEGELEPGFGGNVTFECDAGFDLAAKSSIDASGSGGGTEDGSEAGNISVRTDGPVSVAGTVTAVGRAHGGSFSAEGCDVSVATTGRFAMNGSVGGSTSLTAHRALVVDGTLLALDGDPEADSGSNGLAYRDTVSIGDPKKLRPAAVPVHLPGLTPCP